MTLEYAKAGFDQLIGLDLTSVGPDEVRSGAGVDLAVGVPGCRQRGPRAR